MRRAFLGVLLLAVGAVPGPAGAAAPRWKVHQKISGDVFLDRVEAVGEGATWFFGFDDALRPTSLRWDGKKIKKVAFPRKAKGFLLGADFASADDGWAVSWSRGPEFGVDIFVLRWGGKAWKLAKHESVQGAAPEIKALGRGRVLVTGIFKNGDTELNWWFDGRTWTEKKAKLRLHDFSGRYALGWRPAGQSLVRWDGKRWTKVRVGALPERVKGQRVELDLLEARSPKEIWLTAARYSNKTSAVTYLLRWDGERWRRERVPLPSVHSSIDRIASDGRGGLWAIGSGRGLLQGVDGPGEPLLYHRLPSGKWRSVKNGGAFSDMARVPGTTSLWAVGGRQALGTSAVFTYGKAR
ncbi:hypothetical protein [Actinocorallia populi]|uniref:hypothetical protein n=1 Tax=Actinocorallia populi TaxID=2079200 RepID=UPI000D0975B7|nr:hypothetical protein [Actinocorallia populi]